jgi:hypothetical protein
MFFLSIKNPIQSFFIKNYEKFSVAPRSSVLKITDNGFFALYILSKLLRLSYSNFAKSRVFSQQNFEISNSHVTKKIIETFHLKKD